MERLRLIIEARYPHLNEDGISVVHIFIDGEHVETLPPKKGPTVNAPRRAQGWLTDNKLLPPPAITTWCLQETLAEQCQRLDVELWFEELEIR